MEKTKLNGIIMDNCIYIGLSPCPVTVTTRTIICLVGDPNLNLHLPLLLGGGHTQHITLYKSASSVIRVDQTCKQFTDRIFTRSHCMPSGCFPWSKESSKTAGHQKTFLVLLARSTKKLSLCKLQDPVSHQYFVRIKNIDVWLLQMFEYLCHSCSKFLERDSSATAEISSKHIQIHLLRHGRAARQRMPEGVESAASHGNDGWTGFINSWDVPSV